jgi:hypothetical protein
MASTHFTEINCGLVAQHHRGIALATLQSLNDAANQWHARLPSNVTAQAPIRALPTTMATQVTAFKAGSTIIVVAISAHQAVSHLLRIR